MEVPFLTRLVEHLPTTCGPAEHREYLALVDRALLDRLLSARERDALVELACDLGIDRQTAERLHQGYLAALARAALSDGEVTDEEVRDLVVVATLLGLSREQALAAIHEAATTEAACAAVSDDAAFAQDCFRLSPGDRVVFTGDMLVPREVWIGRAADAGLIAHPSVTKGVALVIAADPDSLSGKARKAASYGIPIVTEEAFAGMLARMAHLNSAR
jgi:DNA polymerase-3 subunit epsilon